jgi:hemerythrin
MSMFVWDPRYSVEIAELDRQHQKLFALLNELYDALQDGQGPEIAGKVLERVMDYTVYHFAQEEMMFDQHGYPDADAHRAEHAKLTAQAKELAQRLRSREAEVPVATLKFLCDWLSKHILGSDKKYAPFLQEKGIH